VLLLGAAPKDGADPLLAPGALAEVAQVVDGIGPPLGRVVDADGRPTPLVATAHAAGLVVHPYTFRLDQLPPFASSADDALQRLFGDAGVDGLFSDFPDVCVEWLARPPHHDRRTE